MKTINFVLRQLGIFMSGAIIMQTLSQNYKAASIYGFILAIIFVIKSGALEIIIEERDRKEKENKDAIL